MTMRSNKAKRINSDVSGIPVADVVSMLEWIPTPALIVDRNLTIEHTNRRAAQFFGYDREAMVNLSFEDLVPNCASLFSALPHTSNSQPLEAAHQACAHDREGRKIPIDILLGPIITEDGEHVFVFILDQTETGKTLATINKKYETLSKQVDNGAVGVFTVSFKEPMSVDLDEREQVEHMLSHSYVCDTNRAFSYQYGIDANNAMDGRRLDEFLPRDDPATVPLLKSLIQNNFTLNNAISFESDKDDNEIVISNAVSGEFVDGKITALYGTAIDITQHNKATRKLELLSSMLNSISDGCLITDADGDMPIRFANRAFLETTGYTFDEIAGKNCRFLQGPDTNSAEIDEIRSALTKGKTSTVELLNYKKDGTPFWNNLTITPVRDRFGEITQFAGIAHDCTEDRCKNEQLASLNQALSRASRRTTLGEMVAAIAHEINQPLTAISANVKAAQRFLAGKSPDLQEFHNILYDIGKDDKRAAEVIRHLRKMLEPSSPSREDLDINEVAQQTVDLLHSDLILKRITLSVEYEKKLPLVLADRIQIQQVVLNLIMNASEAVAPLDLKRHRINIYTAYDPERGVCFSIKDQGPGIEEENLASIFNPFFTTKKTGFGVGLSVCTNIIETHGGSLNIANNEDFGATFTFCLPQSDSHPTDIT